MVWMDTHCHLDAPEFDQDRSEILNQMQIHQIEALVLPAVYFAAWPAIVKLNQQQPRCYASFGFHPIYLAQHQPQQLKELTTWLLEHRAVAVGECGLDFYLPELEVQAQEEWFIAQIRIACELDLPLIIHARRSTDAVLKCLRRFPSAKGVIHSFAGSTQQAELLVKQGFYLGVGGTITYERAQRLRAAIQAMPLEFLVLETDAPDQPDSQWRGKRNDLSRLPVIAQALADLRQESLATIAQATTANAKRLFNLPE
ncbi:MAG: TatD family hydrolase [Thiofilum sp.]|uniref:TatD family hydrolase n=1 Tax=Thiofilum sp. TaxID=2212733 RepID=UPI0025D00CF4|nr:TatD family hydrolase [Thiofilum sp.]MBK8452797.1 TatD family hydrolase [Thiofilum sp.]